MRIQFKVAIIALFCTLGSMIHAQADAEYFPLTQGARYEYKGSMGKCVREIISVDENEASVRDTIYLRQSTLPGKVITSLVFRRGDDGVTSFQRFDDGAVSEEPVLRYPLKVGSKWVEPNRMLPGTFFTHKVAARGVTINVPAGIYENCIRIDQYGPNGMKNGGISTWYAPGVGIVKDKVLGDLVSVSGVASGQLSNNNEKLNDSNDKLPVSKGPSTQSTSISPIPNSEMPAPAMDLSTADMKIIDVAIRDAVKTQRNEGMIGLRIKSEELIRKCRQTGTRSQLLRFIATNRFGIDIDAGAVQSIHVPPNPYFQWDAFIQRLVPLLEAQGYTNETGPALLKATTKPVQDSALHWINK